MRNLLIAIAAAGAVLSPALAYSDLEADGSFRAVDGAGWLANGGSAHELTISEGQTVAFAYPSGNTFHNVDFGSEKPSSCTGVPDRNVAAGPGWAGTCRYDQRGTYDFVCGVHADMTGRVIVTAPAPTATPTPTATPGATSTPGAGATPGPGTTTPPAPQTSLAVKLAKSQRGTRVRGSVRVLQAGSRLEVTLTVARKRAGRYLKQSTASGTVAFSVPVSAKARRGKRRVTVTVRVALTPPGGKMLTRTSKTRLTRG